MPEGITSISARLDHESKNRPSTSTEIFCAKPSNRRSNINAGPTNNTIPEICTISSAGYNHADLLIAIAKELSSTHWSTLISPNKKVLHNNR